MMTMLPVHVKLTIAGNPVGIRVNVPAAPARPAELLPALRVLADAIVTAAVAKARSEGQEPACRKGCGVCCRQLVPITASEARDLRARVAALPEPKQSQVLARFADARRAIAEAGMLEKLRHPESIPPSEANALGAAYFRLGIPCPFLEEESCSIYADRPMVCREYVVSSPAEQCGLPLVEKVKPIRVPAQVSLALTQMDEAPRGRVPFVVLILALEWADAHPDQSRPRPGPDLLREVLEKLTRKSVPVRDMRMGQVLTPSGD